MMGLSKRFERARDERLVQAWHIAALTRCEKMPTLTALLGGGQPMAAQTPDEIKSVFAGMRMAAGVA